VKTNTKTKTGEPDRKEFAAKKVASGQRGMRWERLKPRRARRSLPATGRLTHAVSCPNPTKACQENFQALRGPHRPAPHLEARLLQPRYDLRKRGCHAFVGSPANCSLHCSQLAADAEHRTNKRIRASAPGRSKPFALPTTADGQALAPKKGRGARPCPIASNRPPQSAHPIHAIHHPVVACWRRSPICRSIQQLAEHSRMRLFVRSSAR